MKRIYVLFTALCVCCALAAQDIKELLILHTNDTHSRVEPIPITDPNPEFAGKAGFVRRVTLIKEIRKQDKDLLLFDCGDFSQGSPFYNMFGGEVEVKLMNEIECDCSGTVAESPGGKWSGGGSMASRCSGLYTHRAPRNTCPGGRGHGRPVGQLLCSAIRRFS